MPSLGQWRIDPTDGGAIKVGGDTNLMETSLHDLTGGRFATNGYYIYSPGSTQYTYRQGSAGDLDLLQFRSGALAVQSQLRGKPASFNTSEHATYAYRGDIEFASNDGSLGTLSLDYVPIRLAGYRVVLYVDDLGISHTENVRPGGAREAQLVHLYGGSLRDATVDEALEGALRDALGRHGPEMIDAALNRFGDLTEGGRLSQRSGVTRELARQVAGTLDFYKIHYLPME